MNNIVRNHRKIFNSSDSALSAAVSILSNNVYKITYYEIISGASGTLTLPSGTTINTGEFAGANCVLSEIDGNNKPTYITPLDGGGAPVTSTLNVGTGAWVKSAATVSGNVALIYSINIAAINYQNLDNFYIIDSVLNSGLTVGTTTITGGTNTKVLYNNNGVVGEYTVTGTGSAVLNTSPTFLTDITTPLINGTSGTLQIGTTDLVNIGNAVTTNQRLVRIGQGTGWVDIGSTVGATNQGAIYINTTTPSSTNFSLQALNSNTVLNGSTACYMAVAAQPKITTGSISTSFSQGMNGGGGVTPFTFTLPANINQTLSTNIPNFKITGSSKQWATGTVANQYWNYLSANTAAFVGASTMTNSYGLYVEAATAGTNATITNNYSLGTNGKAKFGGNIELTQTVTTEALVSDTSVTIVINGVTYKLLAKA